MIYSEWLWTCRKQDCWNEKRDEGICTTRGLPPGFTEVGNMGKCTLTRTHDSFTACRLSFLQGTPVRRANTQSSNQIIWFSDSLLHYTDVWFSAGTQRQSTAYKRMALMNKNKYTVPTPLIKIHLHAFLLYKCLRSKAASKHELIFRRLNTSKLILNATRWLQLHFATTKVSFMTIW